MKRLISILIAVALPLAGCAPEDAAEAATGPIVSVTTEPDGVEASQVVVRTRFELAGASSTGAVDVERLYLNVGAIFLEPVAGAGSSIVFSSPDSTELEFDVESGVTSLAGPEMVLPYGGKFAVVMQLEPRSVSELRGKEGGPDTSLEVDGTWWSTRAVPENEDDPMPLPWLPPQGDPDSDPDAGSDPDGSDKGLVSADEDEVPFHYVSGEVARFTLDQVTLGEGGSYDLVLRLQLDEWITERVVPAVEAQIVSECHTPLCVPQALPDNAIMVDADPITVDDTSLANLADEFGASASLQAD